MIIGTVILLTKLSHKFAKNREKNFEFNFQKHLLELITLVTFIIISFLNIKTNVSCTILIIFDIDFLYFLLSFLINSSRIWKMILNLVAKSKYSNSLICSHLYYFLPQY